jgi:uncharacterized protein
MNAKLSEQIGQLPANRLIDFGLTICNKLFPDYVAFVKSNNWGDPEKLMSAILYCQSTNSGNHVETETRKLIQEIMTIIPDAEDFSDWDCSYALNSSAAVVELLEFLLDKDQIHIRNISNYMLDTIDFRISESLPFLDDKAILDHSMLKDAITYQIKLAERLKKQ